MVNIVTKLFWNYINAGKGNFYVEDPRVPFINGFSLILLIILIPFGVQRLWAEGQDALVPAFINFFVSLVLIVNLVALRKTLNAFWASSVLSFCVVLIAGYVFFEGATGGDTGILWVYPIPTLIFFLSGKKTALRWSIILVSLMVSIVVVAKYSGITLPYSVTQLKIFLFPLSAIILGLYVYAKFTEINAQELEERTKSLKAGFESEKTLIEEAGKKKEEALKRELDTFFNTTEQIMGIVKPSGVFAEINPAATKILGYEQEYFLKVPFIEMVHPDDVPGTLKEIESLSKGLGMTPNYINRFKRKDGSYAYLMWNSVFKDGLLYATAQSVDDFMHAQKKNEEKMKEIEDLNRLMVGREVRMAELKEEIAALRQASGKTEDSAHL